MRKAIALAAAMIVWLGLSACPSPAEDQPPVTLKVGDHAPELAPAKWLKGEPVAKFEKGKIYIVEFWATWCGPCRQSIPHLSKLQGEYKDITFIGQDCWERDAAGVPAFVEKMGEQMNYRVALDDMSVEPRGKMAKTWMAAAGQNGIPTAFVVDKETKIAWIGHPMELDGVLKQIAAGGFDAKKAAAERDAKQALMMKFSAAMRKNDYDGAIAAVDEIVKSDPAMADRGAVIKFNLLLQKKDYSAAWELGKTFPETFKDNAQALNDLAWMIVNPKASIEKPDLDLALALASRAVEASKGENGQILDTLARAYFVKGDLDKAVETQSKAVSKASDEQKSQLQTTLDEYKAAKLKPAASDAK